MSKQSTLSFVKKRTASPSLDAPSPKKLARTAFTYSPGTTFPAGDFDLAKAVTKSEGKQIDGPDLDLLCFHPFLTNPGRSELTDWLLRELPWYRVSYATRGINIVTPRYTSVFGCDETRAPASAYKKPPRPIPGVLKDLLAHVEEKTNAHYNFVLVNYYAGGNDSISWHSDDEKFLGSNPCIASLSLGAPRDFMMKHKPPTTLPTEKWTLQPGDMITMRGPTQKNWLHSVPKRANAGGRLNLTFRKAMSVAGTNNYYRYNVGDGPVFRWDGHAMVQQGDHEDRDVKVAVKVEVKGEAIP